MRPTVTSLGVTPTSEAVLPVMAVVATGADAAVVAWSNADSGSRVPQDARTSTPSQTPRPAHFTL